MALDANFCSFSWKETSKCTQRANVIIPFAHKILKFHVSCKDLPCKHKLPLKQTLFLQVRRNLGISLLQPKSELTTCYIENIVFLKKQQLLFFFKMGCPSQSKQALNVSTFKGNQTAYPLRCNRISEFQVWEESESCKWELKYGGNGLPF